MWFVVVVECDLVELPPGWLLSDVLVYVLGSVFVEGDGVVEGLADGLEAEGGLRVAPGESLAVDGADGDAPEVGWDASELRDVLGWLAALDGPAGLVDLPDVLAEGVKVGDDKLVLQCLDDEDEAGVDAFRELLSIKVESLEAVG